MRAVSGRAGGELFRDDRIHCPPGRERGPNLRLGHPAGTLAAWLVLVETEQGIAPAHLERPMETPLEADAIGVGERVEEAAVDRDVEPAPDPLERERVGNEERGAAASQPSLLLRLGDRRRGGVHADDREAA